MIILYGILAVIVSLIGFIYIKFLRVPANLAHLPAVPGMWVTQSERLRRTREIAKTSPFARVFILRWQLLVLHPEYAKTVETNASLFEKSQNRFLKHTFISQFLGMGTNVVGVQTEDWKRHRAVINPAFDFAYIRGFADVFNTVADRLIAELSKLDHSAPIHVHDWTQRYTLDCLGLTAFGFDFESLKNPDNEFAAVYHRLVGSGGAFSPKRFLIPLGLADILPTSENRRLQKDIDEWQKLLDRMTKFGETAQDTDLAAQLLKANAPGAQNYMSLQEIKSNIAIFFIAGHETSATSIASTMWYLARHPEIQQKVYEEVVKVCGKDESPTFQSQQELNYMTQTIYESNRLTSPVRMLPARALMNDTTLGDIKLKKGQEVTVSIESLHYLEREWPNPTEYDPDRFSSDAHHHPFSWQPFGAGPRACLGRNFSILEQRLVLAKLLQKFQFTLPPGSSQEIQVADKPGLVRVESRVLLLPRE